MLKYYRDESESRRTARLITNAPSICRLTDGCGCPEAGVSFVAPYKVPPMMLGDDTPRLRLVPRITARRGRFDALRRVACPPRKERGLRG